MALFSDSGSSSSPLTVDVPEIRVYRAVVTPAEDPEQPPTWGSWSSQPLLKATGVFRGSNFAGMSYAKLELAPGRPADSDDTRVEDENVLKLGDRVAIALIESGTPRILFGGYCTQASINIDGDRESLNFTAVGPEWAWGGNTENGSINPLIGQLRRVAEADDAFADDPGTALTLFDQLFVFSAFPAVFNPGGHRNMTSTDVQLIDAAGEASLGRCFEIPDRKIGESLAADFWTQKQAARMLCLYFGMPAVTGITVPNFDVLDDEKPLRDVNVDGLGLWEALQKVLRPEYGFYVTTKLSNVTGDTWEGFELKFFKRSGGTAANLALNPFDTDVDEAEASVVRLEAVKDIGKTITETAVLGARVKHVRLRYFGGATAEDGDSSIMLQHGWLPDDGNLADFAEARTEQGGTAQDIVDVLSIGNKPEITRNKWKARYVVGGKEFAKYQHVFRLFVWNEAGEWGGEFAGTPIYGKETAYEYQRPDLTNITDMVDESGDPTGIYARHRRPARDTLQYLNSVDAWQRIPPTLYISDDLENTPWIRVPTSNYRLDPDRLAIWITHPDIAQWMPLYQIEQFSDEGVVAGFYDGRTFATLLYTGKLRMMLECSVEADYALEKRAKRTEGAGSPFVRVSVIRRTADYIFSDEYDDGLESPSGVTISAVDTSSDAQAYADLLRASSQDQQTQASILVEADWPGQAIGLFVAETSGRVVNLQGGPTSRGALIVAQHLDFNAMKWELLTESIALQLRASDRLRVTRGKKKSVRSRFFGGGWNVDGLAPDPDD